MSPLKSIMLTTGLALCSMLNANGQNAAAKTKMLPDSLILKNGVTIKPTAQTVFSETGRTSLMFMGYFLKNKMEVDPAGYQWICENAAVPDRISGLMDQCFKDTTEFKNSGHIYGNMLKKPDVTIDAIQLYIYNRKPTPEAQVTLQNFLQRNGMDLNTFSDAAREFIKDTDPSKYQYWRTEQPSQSPMVVSGPNAVVKNHPTSKPE